MNMHDSRPVDPIEEDLVRRVCGGDLSAFESFCIRLEGPLYGYAYGMVRNVHEAEDIVQETLLRVYREMQARRLRPGGRVRSFVFTIAHNLAVDSRRRASSIVPLNPSIPARERNTAEATVLRDQLNLALAELPASHRSALMLREFGELSYAEIAETIGASLGEVKVWIHRGRTRLAQLLDRDGQFVGKQCNDL